MSDARTDWSAILAGAVLATAIALVLIAFGVALGLGATSPYEGEGASRALFATAAGVWLLWIQLVSFSAGGYIAGRLRARRADETEHETDVRDAMHGLLVWGVGVIAAAVISFGSLNAAGRTADDAANAAPASIAQAAAEEATQASREATAEESAENPSALDEALAERQAEVARKWGVMAAFATAASLLAGAVAAFFCAHIGGNHRDRNVVLPFFARGQAPTLRPPTRTTTPSS